MKRLRIFLANLGFHKPMYPHVSPPLGILYLAGYLRTKYEADFLLVNQRVDNLPDEELVRQAVAFEADVVGLGALTTALGNLREVARGVREALPGALIAAGGPHVSSFGARVLEDAMVDAAVPGEGELALEAVLRAWQEGNRADFGNIPGLHWRDAQGEIITNPGTPPRVEDLDTLPFPAYDLIDPSVYWRCHPMTPVPRIRYLSLFSSRGCPCRCIYCHQVFGKAFRRHSAERILEEIRYFQKRFGVNVIEFVDDIFNLDHGRLMAFCEGAAKLTPRVRLSFPNAVRADALTEEEVIAMRAAGTMYCSFALESGSPRIQQLIGKHLNIEKYLKSVEWAAREGIFANGFNMLGFPTETEAEMQQTIDIACGSKLHMASFFTVMPFPGTALYAMAMKTHPEQLARIQYENMDYCLLPVNVSAVPDERLFYYQRMANRRFFMNPVRMMRLLRDFPQRRLLPLYLPVFVERASKGLFRRK